MGILAAVVILVAVSSGNNTGFEESLLVGGPIADDEDITGTGGVVAEITTFGGAGGPGAGGVAPRLLGGLCKFPVSAATSVDECCCG